MSELEKAIVLKERIVYELCVALGIDPDLEDIDNLSIPDLYSEEVATIYNFPSRHNVYVALKRNYQVLKKMKESLNNG